MHRKRPKSGFTLIELITVIAIIGILAGIVLVSVTTLSDRARDASFQSTAAGINAALTVCCDGGGTLQGKSDGAGGGVAICADTSIIATTYPDDDNIGTVSIGAACSNGAYVVTMTPGDKNTGSCTSALYNQNGLDSFTGC